jgi:hypothetical protein
VNESRSFWCSGFQGFEAFDLGRFVFLVVFVVGLIPSDEQTLHIRPTM